MSSRDLAHSVKTIAAWAGATINSDTDTTSTIVIDSQGFESVMFAAYVGAITDGTYKLKVMETDNSDGTTDAAEVTKYQVQDSFTKTPTDDSNKVKKVGAVLTKRYCTLRISSTGTTSGAVFKGAIAILGHPRSVPVA